MELGGNYIFNPINPEVAVALSDAGWHEGRDVDVTGWVLSLKGAGFHLNGHAVRAWRSFGGLTIWSGADREPSSSLRIDPWDACGDRLDESDMLRGRHGVGYSPLGLWSGQFRAYVGDDGRVIATQIGQEYLLGSGVAEALEFVVCGDSDGNRRPWVYEVTGEAALAMPDARSHKIFLESAGLMVADTLWAGPVAGRYTVWRSLRSRYIDPIAIIPADGSVGSLVTAQEVWREKSAEAGLFGVEGEFIISTAGDKSNRGLPWSLVRAGGNIRLLEGLADRQLPAEFVSMSEDGRVASAVKMEGDSLLVFATPFMSGKALVVLCQGTPRSTRVPEVT